mgnify:CR=1 FL=1
MGTCVDNLSFCVQSFTQNVSPPDFINLSNFLAKKPLKKICHRLYFQIHKTLYQNCAYIFKPNTPFTKEWIDTLHQKLDEKYELLKQYPATEPREVIGMEKKNKEISKYPLQWAEILGTIFHDICYKYKHKLLYELPPVNTDSYL